MCRCSMQYLLSEFINYFLDFIHSCRYIYTEISHTEETIYDQRSSLLREDLYDLTGTFSVTTTQIQRTKKPTCSFLSIARLQSYSPADLKHIIMVFWDFHHTRSSTQGIPVQRKPIWQLDVHLSTIVLSSCLHRQSLIIMLQYGGQVGYKYESLPTRKDRYTLLLESPFLIILKFTNGCFYGRIVSLIYHSTFVSLKNLTHISLRKRQLNWIPTSYHFQKRYNQPAHRV